MLALAVGVIAGCGSSSSTTTSPETTSEVTSATTAKQSSQQEEAPTVERTLPTETSVMNTCANHVRAGAHTTCQFAENVRTAFESVKESSGVSPAIVGAYSPVTNRHYKLNCVLIAGGTTAECKAGTAEVAFPIQSEAASESESSPTPVLKASEENGGPGAEEGENHGAEGEDEVGSPSHAGDAKFCSEHECIGSFTTEEGTVVECSDGTYSHAGGISGACSHHGGESG